MDFDLDHNLELSELEQIRRLESDTDWDDFSYWASENLSTIAAASLEEV